MNSILSHSIGVTIKDITFSGLIGTQNSGTAGEFLCSDSVPCTDIHLENIDIDTAAGVTKNSFNCWSAYGTATNVHPNSCLGKKDN